MLGASAAAPIALIAILNFGTNEAVESLSAETTEHRSQLDSLRAGRWPTGRPGERIAALAERLDSETVKRIRRYWELQAWLVLEAEEAMLEEAESDAVIDPVAIRAALDELAGLRRAIGRSTFAAFKPLLPFSRNDAWEVAELRQKIRGL